MGKRDENLTINEVCSAGLSKMSTISADLWLLSGQFRGFAIAARGKLIATLTLLGIEIALSFLFVFAFARLAEQAMSITDGGVLGWTVGRDANEMAMILSVAALLLVTGKYFERLWMMQVGEKAIVGLSKEVFAQIVSQPMAFFAGSQGRAVAPKIVDDISRVRDAWTRDLLSVLRSLLLVLVASILMFKVAPEFAWPIVGLALALGAGWMIFVWLLTRKETVSYGNDDLFGAAASIAEAISGLATVKAFGNETHERTRFRHRVEYLLVGTMRSAGKRVAVLAAGSLALLGLVIYLWWLGATALSEARLLAGEFTALVLLLVIAGAAVRQFTKRSCGVIASGRAARRLDILLGKSTEHLDSGNFMPNSRQRLDGRLNISKASFAYPDAPEHWVIDSLSLAILPGEKVAIVGPPGCGKTALAHLILGYYPLQSGGVEFDARPLADYPLSWLRSQIGWVPAETWFFSGTVAENIAYGRTNASAAEIRDAADKAGALPFIESLQNGFDTCLASDIGGAILLGGIEKELRLSAEQQRRFALARVFLEDPPIVFIDAPATRIVEQTNAIRKQGKSAGVVDRSLRSVEKALMKDRTAIVVATRMSTTRAMDKILVLRDGKVAERGSHKELYQGRGFYRLLCEGQFGKD